MERLRDLMRRLRGPRPSRRDPTRNRQCTEFESDAWELSRFVMARLVPVVGIHPFPLHELMLMTAAVCRLRPAQIFEWGTHIGASARVFHECREHFGIGAEVHSTDLPDDVDHGEHPGRERGRLVRGLRGVWLHQGDGLETSLRLWSERGRAPHPLFFIDGDHAYETVLREAGGIAQEIPGAAMLLHDTFYQSPQSGYNVGPSKAVQEVLALSPGRYREIRSGLGLPGMTLLYPEAALCEAAPPPRS